MTYYDIIGTDGHVSQSVQVYTRALYLVGYDTGNAGMGNSTSKMLVGTVRCEVDCAYTFFILFSMAAKLQPNSECL